MNLGIIRNLQDKVIFTVTYYDGVAFLMNLTDISSREVNGTCVPWSDAKIATHVFDQYTWFCIHQKCLLHDLFLRLAFNKNL